MNKLLSTLLVSLLLVATAAAQSYPNLPIEFSADVSIKVESSMSPFPIPGVSGTMYYSYSRLVQRIDATNPMFGMTVTTLDRYDEMNEYQFAQGSSQCECSQLSGKMPSYTVLPGSSYQGQTNVNGIMSDAWSFSMVPGVNITLYVDPTNVVLTQAVMVFDQMGSVTTTTMTFENVNTNTLAASVFTVPSYCSNSCPTPPPVPTPNPKACPNNPPAGCDCPSKLNFCSGVTYPINSDYASNEVDSMVQQTFENFVTFSNPSQACQNNMKALLCATLFPVCTGSIIPVLPCPSLCPCACDSSVNNSTCGAAFSGSVCTNYGSQSFC